MRDISVKTIQNELEKTLANIGTQYEPDVLSALKKGRENEEDEASRAVMDILLKNAEIACTEHTPICQDTGMVIVWISAGQEVHFTDGSLKDAVNRAVSNAYTENYFRASMEKDPLFYRENSTDNTPAWIYMDLVEGDKVHIDVMAKGFGSENMSAQAMLKPGQGVEGVKNFVLDTIRKAGPNACPPMVIGVGIGGTFDGSAYLSKRALLRPLSQSSAEPEYRTLEEELLEKANALKIGPAGFHGKTTALKVQIEHAPTHIAGLPVAVNICCHACRHGEIDL